MPIIGVGLIIEDEFDFETGKSTAHHTIIDLDTKKEIEITGKESEPKEKCCIGLSDSNKL